jgi:uncharacterized phage-associated protein
MKLDKPFTGWRDTSAIPEDNGTASKELGIYVTLSNPFNLEFNSDTTSEPLPDGIFQEPQKLKREKPKVLAFDVASYILQKMGTMTTMKLQKLVYYSQGWSLVWDEKRLFEEDIEAWANGPIVKNLFHYHRGTYQISSVLIGNPRLLDQEQRDTVDAVLDYYGDKSAQWLINLTQMEEPWIETRKGLPIQQRGNRAIPLDVMADYYSSLPVEEEGEDEAQEI